MIRLLVAWLACPPPCCSSQVAIDVGRKEGERLIAWGLGWGEGGGRTSDQEMGGGLWVVASEAASSSRSAPKCRMRRDQRYAQRSTSRHSAHSSAATQSHTGNHHPLLSRLRPTATPSPILWSQLSRLTHDVGLPNPPDCGTTLLARLLFCPNAVART